MQHTAPKSILHGRYRLLRPLDSNVWLVRDQWQKQLVVLKQTSRASVRDLVPAAAEAAIQAIEQEPHFLMTYSHEQLPYYVDHFSDETSWYLVQEWVRGISSAEYRYQGPVSPELWTEAPPNLAHVLAIGLQFCTVLGYLHTRFPPLIHRDVKEANALITTEGCLVLIDLGISSLQHDESRGIWFPIGTRGYAAPEQYSRDIPTPLEDIYSLGITLCCLIFGEDSRDVAQTLAGLPSPCRIMPEALRQLLASMTKRDSRYRPSSMIAVAEELRRIFENMTGLSSEKETLCSLLTHPGPTHLPLPRLWEKRRYLFRPATKLHPQPCWVWSTCTKFVPSDEAVEMEFIHPSKGTTERRWLTPEQYWRLQ